MKTSDIRTTGKGGADGVRPRLQAVTLGCSKNRVDTEHLLSRLEGLYEIVPESEEEAVVDVLLLNTCGFIGDAKEESVNAILEAVERKSRGEVGQIIVFGCLSQRYETELPELIPEVDAWFGATDTEPIARALGAGEPSESAGIERLLTTPSHYAYLKISEGCDRRCSYCAIPFIRGRHRSVPMEELVAEAELLAGKGVKELILIAQDTTYYGLDLYKKRALGELLKKLVKIDGIEWIRIHYSYPDDFPNDVLELMAAEPKICRYIDIPLQHIADPVLSAMRRNVDGEWTRRLVRTMREKVPGVMLRTTMIVGHPGEGEKEFEALLDFMAEARFERLGAFRYSEEEGTCAISLECNLARVGSELRVIVDSYNDGILVCRSEFESPEVDGEILVKYDPAAFGGADPLSFVGSFITVKVTAADEYDLTADLVSM